MCLLCVCYADRSALISALRRQRQMCIEDSHRPVIALSQSMRRQTACSASSLGVQWSTRCEIAAVLCRNPCAVERYARRHHLERSDPRAERLLPAHDVASGREHRLRRRRDFPGGVAVIKVGSIPAACSLLPALCCLLSVAYSLLAVCLLESGSLLPAVCCLSLAACCLLCAYSRLRPLCLWFRGDRGW